MIREARTQVIDAKIRSKNMSFTSKAFGIGGNPLSKHMDARPKNLGHDGKNHFHHVIPEGSSRESIFSVKESLGFPPPMRVEDSWK